MDLILLEICSSSILFINLASLIINAYLIINLHVAAGVDISAGTVPTGPNLTGGR